MKKWLRFVLGAMLGAYGIHTSGSAQEMRVYTKVYDGSSSTTQKIPEQRSLMLFHAGKVYDYIEPAQEVTVFEPAHRRFTVLNVPRQLRSELTQDEIRQFLGLAENEAQKRLANSDSQVSSATRNALDLLRFQLQPEFSTTFDPTKSKFSLLSPQFQYVAVGFAPPSQDLVEKYLHVADWTAQFNAVLHPQSMLPAPRLKLNQELRHQGLLPSSVHLQAEADPAIHLEAIHEWTWNLQKTDRQMIDDWEKQLQSSKLRTVSFRQFQQEMLRTDTAKKR